MISEVNFCTLYPFLFFRSTSGPFETLSIITFAADSTRYFDLQIGRIAMQLRTRRLVMSCPWALA